MSRSALRGVAVASVAAITLAAPVSAFAATHGHTHQSKVKTHSSHKHHGKPASTRFTATGSVVSVGTGTVTIADKGGSKDLHGKTITVVVSSTTKVTRDDATVTLDKLQAGDHVAANGTRGTDGSLNAKHVNADSTPEPDASQSASPEPTSTDTPAPTPTDTATAAGTTTG